MIMKIFINMRCLVVFFGFICCCFLSCRKDSYYKDYGVIDDTYSGSMLDYLKGHKYHQFDSLVKIINLAGLDTVIQSGNYTFFAPGDSAIKLSVALLNTTLKSTGKDTVSDLDQISRATWRDMLSMYIFPGLKKVADYPQVDMSALPSFHGQAYTSFENARIMNIGAIYEDASGVQYAGYRHLVLSYIPSYSAPLVNWINNYIASSDIVTSNGIIHSLQYSNQIYVSSSNTTAIYFGAPVFGFDPSAFSLSAISNGINY